MGKKITKENPSSRAWKRFKQNRLALAGTGFILLSACISVLGYLVVPDQTPYANEQFLTLTTKKPGFKVTILEVKKNEPSHKRSFITRMLFGEPADYKSIPINKYHFDKGDMIVEEYSGEAEEPFFTTFSLADVVYPLKYGTDIKIINDSVQFTTVRQDKIIRSISDLQEHIIAHQMKEQHFILGTDRFGRDLLSRLLIGTRVSLSIGAISVMISLLIGLTLGLIAGYFRGWADRVIQWVINVFWSIPTLLLVIAITFMLGKGFWQIFMAVGLSMWVEVARVTRGQVFSIREKEYIESAKALGYSHFRILFRHILPNIVHPLIIISAANFASAILIEAGLSFLGIGVQPPIPSWGTMIKEHYGYILVDLAYLAIAPGIAIMLMVLAFTLVGNGLRDAMDVKNS